MLPLQREHRDLTGAGCLRDLCPLFPGPLSASDSGTCWVDGPARSRRRCSPMGGGEVGDALVLDRDPQPRPTLLAAPVEEPTPPQGLGDQRGPPGQGLDALTDQPHLGTSAIAAAWGCSPPRESGVAGSTRRGCGRSPTHRTSGTTTPTDDWSVDEAGTDTSLLPCSPEGVVAAALKTPMAVVAAELSATGPLSFVTRAREQYGPPSHLESSPLDSPRDARQGPPGFTDPSPPCRREASLHSENIYSLRNMSI